jgi:hypothetical protein
VATNSTPNAAADDRLARNSRWLELQCPDCGMLFLGELVEPDGRCTLKSCKTHPILRPYLLNQLELAQHWLLTQHGRSSVPPPAITPKA